MSTIGTLDRDLESLLDGFHDHHSPFQIDHAIIERGGDGHVWGMHRQALRELATRRDELARQRISLEELKLDLAQSLTESRRFVIFAGSRYRKRKAAIKVKQLTLRIVQTRNQIRGIERESLRFVAHARSLEERIAQLPAHQRDSLELEYWEHRFKLELISSAARDPQGRPSLEVLQMLPFFPTKIRQGLHDVINNLPNEVNTYMMQPDQVIARSELPSSRMTPAQLQAIK